MDVHSRIPSALLQHYDHLSLRMSQILNSRTHRILSFGGGVVEKDSAHPFTVRSAAINIDCFFFDPNFFTASRAFATSFESCAAFTASSPQHFFACRWSTPVGSQLVSMCPFHCELLLTSRGFVRSSQTLLQFCLAIAACVYGIFWSATIIEFNLGICVEECVDWCGSLCDLCDCISSVSGMSN